MQPWRPWTVLTELFIFYLLGLDCEGQKELKVRRGENATLECYGPSEATEIMLRWTKPDLQTNDYVIYLKDGHLQKDLQHDLFKGRVKLKDSKWMTNGNFSVILKNVTLNDSGTYKCYAAYNNQAAQPLNSISLKVEDPPGQQGGHTDDGGKKIGFVGLRAGLSVSAVLLVAAVGFVIYTICRNSKYKSPSEQGRQMEISS
ncbi:V-set domain-containing T-cell activation inhibitor 1-like [Neolamprologus brichardi]|uniref:V-set domain-containing T-cell activation inhibitor 1-like n=1 Tax=Neolamprologus brichardi TaxID=32507 RepID=UPI0003EBC375|nr:V-set domain-containing T-cell activation inhibitor 1-like [Neolamprologus brichardi]